MFLESFTSLFGNVLVGLWVGVTLFAGLVGLWAFVLPVSFVEWSRRLSLWIEIDREQERVAHEVKLERPFYRYHVVTGLLIVAGTLFVGYQVLFELHPEEIKRLFVSDQTLTAIWVEIIIDAAFGWIYISSIFAFVIGVIVTLRPSYLKGMEQKANIWVETRHIGSVIDKRNNLLDKWVCVHPRWFGILALLGSLLVAYLIVRLGYLA